jgi:hypothetical protein
MAKVSAKGAVIILDDSAGTPRTISTDVESYEIQYAVDEVEVTGMNEGSHNHIAGQLIVGVTLNLFWNSAATTGAWTVVRGIIGSTSSKTLSITPESGAVGLSGEFMCTGVSISGSPSTDIKLGSVKFSVMGSTAPAWA